VQIYVKGKSPGIIMHSRIIPVDQFASFMAWSLWLLMETWTV